MDKPRKEVMDRFNRIHAQVKHKCSPLWFLRFCSGWMLRHGFTLDDVNRLKYHYQLISEAITRKFAVRSKRFVIRRVNLKTAKSFVNMHHRHHIADQGYFFGLGLFALTPNDEQKLIGVV